jgi:phage-related protein
MAGSRTLKLTILGDVDNLNKSLKAATQDVDTFGDKMTKAGKVVGAALVAAAAAAGAYAVKIGIDGVKAAIEDEKAQTQLALALQNAAGATDAAIASTENWILQTSLATGVADDQLRPALQRLALSTGDVSKAQDLLKVALDVATATGKPLETVANALGKAYDGNTAALGKLGIGLSAAELKTMSFTQVQDKLSTLFGGAAAANAETYSGRLARMQVAFDEAKETIGFALLPILEKLMKFINDIALPAINAMSKGFGLDKGGIGESIQTLGKLIMNVFTPIWNGLVKAFGYVRDAIGDNLSVFKEFGGYIAEYLAPVVGTVLGGALQVVGKIAGGVIDIIASVIKVINGLIGGAIDGINALIRAYNAIPLLPNISQISKPTLNTPSVSSGSVAIKTPSIPTLSTPTTSSGAVASASAAGAAVANSGFVNQPNQASTFAADQARVDAVIAAANARANVTVNMGVVGDPESAARTIIDVLNRSSGRGALGAEALIL